MEKFRHPAKYAVPGAGEWAERWGFQELGNIPNPIPVCLLGRLSTSHTRAQSSLFGSLDQGKRLIKISAFFLREPIRNAHILRLALPA